ncbi:hypothetical protein C0Z18_23130 [Trinickia dabaoshanensis]|uniref:Uncharacterized protein n=1 Tax=Trinickia dabaoshanensis TaxID=564714 RepID=A0A2N7VH42_9BURK|nr:hypothetical protein [Trinickia dabaoshanensis]PMS16466.1 hypothetical protein C0Z18_23130 [Trinickia dabaoshanensis]
MRKQLFTMRLSESLAAAVESIKLRRKESSSSEVARRLLELGIEADRRAMETTRSLPEEPRAALLVLRDRYYRDDPLTREEWEFLATMAHHAYMHPGRSFVTRSLLVDVLSATKALLSARTRHLGKSELPSDRYYRSKLDLREDESLLDGIERVQASLPEWPDATYAEWLTRPIEGYFSGEEPALPDNLLNQTLKPYLLTLLTLAIRRFWQAEGKPITDTSNDAPTFGNMRQLNPIEIDGLSLSFTVMNQRLSAILGFGEILPMLLSLPSLPVINDFFDLVTASTRPGTRHPEYEAGPRRISLPIQHYKKFILWDGDKNFHFEIEEMERIANLAHVARSDPDFISHEKAARLAYGAI